MAVAAACTTVVNIVMSMASSFELVLVMQLCYGLLGGGSEVVINTLTLQVWGEHVGPYMQLLHACFAIGTVVRPMARAVSVPVIQSSAPIFHWAVADPSCFRAHRSGRWWSAGCCRCAISTPSRRRPCLVMTLPGSLAATAKQSPRGVSDRFCPPLSAAFRRDGRTCLLGLRGFHCAVAPTRTRSLHSPPSRPAAADKRRRQRGGWWSGGDRAAGKGGDAAGDCAAVSRGDPEPQSLNHWIFCPQKIKRPMRCTAQLLPCQMPSAATPCISVLTVSYYLHSADSRRQSTLCGDIVTIVTIVTIADQVGAEIGYGTWIATYAIERLAVTEVAAAYISSACDPRPGPSRHKETPLTRHWSYFSGATLSAWDIACLLLRRL